MVKRSIARIRRCTDGAGRQPDAGDTAATVLDVAERLVQIRGFNGFSYADVAAELGITKASLHYHFPGKAELGEALIARYATRFADALAAIDASERPTRPTKLDAYAAPLRRGPARAADVPLRHARGRVRRRSPTRCDDAVVRFFDDNESWLARVLEQGRTRGHAAVDRLDPARWRG